MSSWMSVLVAMCLNEEKKDLVWWCKLTVSVLRRPRQEDDKFKPSLTHTSTVTKNRVALNEETLATSEAFDATLRFIYLYLCICVCVPIWIRMYHIHVGTHGGQKRTSDSLGLELLIALSHLRWILRTKFRSFAKSSLMARPPLQIPGSLSFLKKSFIFICLHAYMYIGRSHAPIIHTHTNTQ